MKYIESYKNHETNSHWFEKHSKQDFTSYTKIFAKICWSYWIVGKYSYLTNMGRTKEAEVFIEEHRYEVFKKVSSAASNINEWINISSDMRLLLLAIYKSAETFLNESIEMSNRINFHNKYGVKIEEPLDNLLETMEKEQYLMRMYAQHTDETDLNFMYYRWANAYYEAYKYLSSVKDNNSWEIFKRFCLKNIPGTLPTQELIEHGVMATIAHLEIKDDIRNDVARKCEHLWQRLFMTSAQFNHFLMFLAGSKEFPSGSELDKAELHENEVIAIQIETSIAVANIFINDEIYTS